MLSLRQIVSELKARNVRTVMTIYISTALTTIGIVRLFADAYNLPKAIFPIVVTILTCGLISAFVFAWYHGSEGRQPVRKREILIHLVVFVIAGVITLRVSSLPFKQARQLGGKSIAVLPFKNMSENKEDEYFSDGIMEDILTQLSKIGDLQVISRTTMMKYKDSNKSIREIGAELNVATVLEGSVRREGNRVRIVGQLIDAGTDEHIWANSYDREMKDIFAIQAEVAKNIAEELKAQLSPEEEDRLKKEATSSVDAYAFYLRGRDYYYRHTTQDNETAIELFKKAISLDTTYALAFTGLADAYAQRYQRYGYPQNWADTSIALSEHAIALDPNIAEPYKSLGLAYYQREWYQKALAAYRKALSLNPNFAAVYANMGEILDWIGQQDETIELVNKAISLEPGRAVDYLKLGSAYYSLGMDSLSIVKYKKALALDPSVSGGSSSLAEIYNSTGNIPYARRMLDSVLTINPEDALALASYGNLELYERRYDKALIYYQRCYNVFPDYFGLLTSYGFCLLKTGRTAEGNTILDLSVKTNEGQIAALSEEGYRRYDLARVAAIRKDTTAALRWLREAMSFGSVPSRTMEKDPLLENIRREPAFQDVVNESKRKAVQMRTRVEARMRAATLAEAL